MKMADLWWSSKGMLFALMFVVLGLCATVGCKPPKKEEPKPEPVVVDESPAIQELFAKANGAVLKGDYATYVDCMTPQSQDVLAGKLMMSAVKMKEEVESTIGPMLGMSMPELPEVEKAMKEQQAILGKIDTILKKYGIDPAKVNTDLASDNAECAKAGAAVNDKTAFVVDVLDYFKSLSGGGVPNSMIAGDLTQLEVVGDHATAVILNRSGGMSYIEPIEFSKIDDQWKIELPLDKVQ